MTTYRTMFGCLFIFTLFACSDERGETSVSPLFEPTEIIDLGALVTEDLPQRVWGKAFLAANDLDRLRDR